MLAPHRQGAFRRCELSLPLESQLLTRINQLSLDVAGHETMRHTTLTAKSQHVGGEAEVGIDYNVMT